MKDTSGMLSAPPTGPAQRMSAPSKSISTLLASGALFTEISIAAGLHRSILASQGVVLRESGTIAEAAHAQAPKPKLKLKAQSEYGKPPSLKVSPTQAVSRGSVMVHAPSRSRVTVVKPKGTDSRGRNLWKVVSRHGDAMVVGEDELQ